MKKELRDFFWEEENSFEELMKEFDEDELWEKYMEDHLKKEEECRKRASLRRRRRMK